MAYVFVPSVFKLIAEHTMANALLLYMVCYAISVIRCMVSNFTAVCVVLTKINKVAA